jgi:putative endonuclease
MNASHSRVRRTRARSACSPLMRSVRAADRRRLGADAEQRAAQLLRAAGFEVLMQNYRWRGGELDLVARRGALLVIAEVRLRSSLRFGGAAASITAAKRQRLRRTAQHLLARHPQLAHLQVRFDALLAAGAHAPLEWLQGVM